MSQTQFIAKQHLKYYWKVILNGSREDTTDILQSEESFWQYEQTPRSL